VAQEQGTDIHPGLEPRRQQVEAADLAMQEQGIGRRGVPELPVHAQLEAHVADAQGQV
jgi:hypothetical protein